MIGLTLNTNLLQTLKVKIFVNSLKEYQMITTSLKNGESQVLSMDINGDLGQALRAK